MGLVVLVGLILVLLFFLGSFVLARSARRYRQFCERRRAVPTSSEDVWSMHKLPDDWDSEPDPNDQQSE